MRDIPQHPRRLFTLLASALVLYLLLATRYHVGGVFNDDGMYVLAAKSLAHGHYSQLNLPWHPPFTLYPPGWPLFLAPFTLLAGSHLALLKAVPIAVTLLYLALLWIIVSEWLSPGWLTIWFLLCALNPVVAMFSSLLMSEPCFLAALMATFIVFEREPHDPSGKSAWVLGLLMGSVALIRSEGLVIFPAVALGLAYRRRWISLRKSVLAGLLLFGLFVLRNNWVATGPSTYQRGWTLVFQEIHRHPQVLFHNATDGLSIFVLQNLVSPLIPIDALPVALVGLLGLAGAWLAGYGTWLLWKTQPQAHAQLITIGTYCLFYVGLHVIWLTTELRYGLSILPFVLAATFKAAESQVQRGVYAKRFWSAVISLMLFSYLVQNARAVHIAWTARDRSYPKETYVWIAASIPKDAVMLASGPAGVYLYTGRWATIDAPARDGEEFRYRLITDHIRYIVFGPLDFGKSNYMGKGSNHLWGLRKRWVSMNRQAYRLVYQNPVEEREVYEVLPDPAFQDAYRQYLSVTNAFDRSEWAEGFGRLEQILKKDPWLISAYNAYGVGSLLSGMKTDAGLKRLRQGHLLAPDNALLLLNLARLEQRVGDTEAAETYARQAAAAAKVSGEYTRLFEDDLPGL